MRVALGWLWCGLGVALVWPWCGLGVALVWPWCGLGVALVWPWCGLGVALVWPWCGLGVALVWPWCGLGVALVWPWCGFGVALVWLCSPESMPSICLVYGFAVALGGLSAGASRKSENSVIMRIAARPLPTIYSLTRCTYVSGVVTDR